ncbi:patatin family protein [Streptomyces sp. ST2-7A]|uniref:patatin-like phospholipase family protein n=1 Tax=Streptomyces sp. ST2-7A TaxID=2907214 RepID=UPI001F1958CD|nr:patatin-like phospholipase family protein [Streptomyces sp. ST2-7A]MCE7083028.1 patatin-like phospholipase family protein [Streptomyces sp. ST2-7A]
MRREDLTTGDLTTGERHEVLRVIADRSRDDGGPGSRRDGLRLALVIEGGGMRGTISAGMALALHEAGVARVFDAVYGASAGAITGAWLLSNTPENLAGWADPLYARAMIRPSNLWRRRPMVDVHHLIEHLYPEVARMDFDSVLANPVELHPLATDAHSGLSTDLRPFLTGPAELRLALRASAALPFLAGPPVRLGGQVFYDAGLAESIPYRTALAQGATHVLVLRSRSAPMPSPVAGDRGSVRPSFGARLITSTALRSYPKALHDAFHARGSRLSEDDALLAAYDRSGLPTGAPPVETATRTEPAVLSIRPALDSPRVGRLTRDGKTLKAALEAGRTAVERLLS